MGSFGLFTSVFNEVKKLSKMVLRHLFRALPGAAERASSANYIHPNKDKRCTNLKYTITCYTRVYNNNTSITMTDITWGEFKKGKATVPTHNVTIYDGYTNSQRTDNTSPPKRWAPNLKIPKKTV